MNSNIPLPEKIRSTAVITLTVVLALLAVRTTAARSNTTASIQADSGLVETHFLPAIFNAQIPVVDLESSWRTDAAGTQQVAFLSGDPLTHWIGGSVAGSQAITGTLTISESGPCGSALVYSDIVVLAPGSWQQSVPSIAPSCTGVYTVTARLAYGNLAPSLSALALVTEPSSTSYSSGQGFDKCYPPSIDQMQTWWDQSPYSVFNIYLGGISYACDPNPLDAFWVKQAADQGWKFTLIWVGPQAPCTGYTHKMSGNAAQAHQEGRDEAEDAAAAARYFGFFGSYTIHYDVEAYSGASTACRAAVQSFMQGWTDRLHELGLDAGGYGSSCSSYLSDWNNNNPAPDQVWIAAWTDDDYNPNATVWNVACLSNSLWSNNARLRQYAGGHNETWGGTTFNIDSNVFDTTVVGAPAAQASVEDFGLWGPRTGWLQIEGRLFRVSDDVSGWTEMTPPGSTVLGAAFLDGQAGWAAVWLADLPGLQLARTTDGGRNWEFVALDPAERLDPEQIGGAFIEILDASRIWVAVRLQSGSSFSLGRLYASSDGGRSWEARPLPLGEAVHFESASYGWISGGPMADAFYLTRDGGRTWQAAEMLSPVAEAAVFLPGSIQTEFWDGQHAWLLVQEGTCMGEKNAQVCELKESLWATDDGGETWAALPLPAAGAD